MFRLSITDCRFIFVSNCTTIIQIFVFRIAWLSIGYVIRNTFFKSINLFSIFFSNIEILIFISSFIDETIHFACCFTLFANVCRCGTIFIIPSNVASNIFLTWVQRNNLVLIERDIKVGCPVKIFGFNVCCFQCKFKTVIAQLTYI